jgi:type VI secretion system protein VasD
MSVLVLSGCETGSNIRKAVSKTLETVGLKEPPKETERKTQLRLYAGNNLNAGSGEQAIATVVRIYQLRNAQKFEEAAFDVFLNEARERTVLGTDLINVSEIVLMPNERRELDQTVPIEGQAIGVVALFRAPATNRWRLAFDMNSKTITTEGITIGLHACALTTTSSSVLAKGGTSLGSLTSVRCSDAPVPR